MFDAIVFAGGGNRCYWQGAVMEALGDLAGRPRLVVGASAGAWQATYTLLGRGSEVRAIVDDWCRKGLPNIDWSRRAHPSGALFPVAPMYRALVAGVVDEAAFARLKALTDLRIAIAHPPAWLPGVAAPLVGIGAYQLEKRLFAPVHPRFGTAIGFRPRFLSVRDMDGPAEFVDAVMASATVPPFMPVLRIAGERALDGGLVDNVPVAPLRQIEAAGGRTLVLLTRPYVRLPEVPGRLYWQPSEKIPVSQFDITNADGIRLAVELGFRDGEKLAARLRAGASA